MEDKNRELNVEELEQGAGGNITYKEFEEKAKQQMRQAKDQVGRRWNGSGDRTGAGHWRIASGIPCEPNDPNRTNLSTITRRIRK